MKKTATQNLHTAPRPELSHIVMTVSEWFHPVLILAPLFPVLYMVLRQRDDALIIPMYLISLAVLLPVSVLLKTAASRARHLWAYLFAGILAAGVCLAGTRILSAMASSAVTGLSVLCEDRILRTAFQAALMVEVVFLFGDTFAIRLNDNRRRKAILENDPYWRSESHLTEKPERYAPVWFVILYAAGLCFHCPQICSISLCSGTAYLLMLVVYLYITETERYLSDRDDISHVPVRRIRKISQGVLTVFVIMIVLCVIPAALTSGSRHYTDVRDIRTSQTALPADPFFEQPAGGGPMMDPEMLEMLAAESKEPSLLMEILGYIVSAVCMLAFVVMIIAGIRSLFAQFRDRPDENGDEAVSLEPEDDIIKIVKSAAASYFSASPKEQVRRQYRKMIRRHRKDKPAPAETPAEIERNAGIQNMEEMKTLHARYEQVRYGK